MEEWLNLILLLLKQEHFWLVFCTLKQLKESLDFLILLHHRLEVVVMDWCLQIPRGTLPPETSIGRGKSRSFQDQPRAEE